eukprot:747077-Pleurochrysis_carterae.AAC.2
MRGARCPSALKRSGGNRRTRRMKRLCAHHGQASIQGRRRGRAKDEECLRESEKGVKKGENGGGGGEEGGRKGGRSSWRRQGTSRSARRLRASAVAAFLSSAAFLSAAFPLSQPSLMPRGAAAWPRRQSRAAAKRAAVAYRRTAPSRASLRHTKAVRTTHARRGSAPCRFPIPRRRTQPTDARRCG